MATGPASQVAVSSNRRTSNARARAKVEARRNCSKTTIRAEVLRVLTARVIPVSRSRIRVAGSLGTATSAAKLGYRAANCPQ